MFVVKNKNWFGDNMNIVKEIFKDRSFIKKTLAIAVPVTAQNLLSNMLNLVDSLLIIRLGEASVTSVSLANKYFFVFSLLMFGISSGSSILASQYYGKRDMLGIKRVFRISIMIGVLGGLLFMLPALLNPHFIMSIITSHQDMIQIGSTYLVVIAISYPITAITISYSSILRSMNYVKVPMLVTTFAIIVNVILNFGFIFGMFGLPRLGVAGSALATVIARTLECTLLIAITRFCKEGDDSVGDFIHAKYKKTKENLEPFINRLFVKKYFFTASPVIANEFMWGLGVTIYAVVYGRMEPHATAAITITNIIESIIVVSFLGLCNSSAVILGNELGGNELKKAEKHAKYFMVLQFMISIVVAIITFLLKDVIVSLFPASSQAIHYIKNCMIVLSISIPIRALNTQIIVSILRSGGDTLAALFLDISGVWFIGIPMAYLGGIVFHLPIYIVYAMVLLEELYKLILGYIRYRQKKWIKNIVVRDVI